jgi:hypothetical protein
LSPGRLAGCTWQGRARAQVSGPGVGLGGGLVERAKAVGFAGAGGGGGGACSLPLEHILDAHEGRLRLPDGREGRFVPTEFQTVGTAKRLEFDGNGEPPTY